MPERKPGTNFIGDELRQEVISLLNAGHADMLPTDCDVQLAIDVVEGEINTKMQVINSGNKMLEKNQVTADQIPVIEAAIQKSQSQLPALEAMIAKLEALLW